MRSRRNDCNICQSAIERYVWDGDDLIRESRYQGRDGIEPDTLEQDSGPVSELISYGPITPPDTVRMYSPHYGVTRYVHAGVIDRPLLAMRAYFGQDSFYVGEVWSVLHYDWRGVVDEGTTLSGSAVGSSGIRVDWPGADVLLFGNRWLNGAARSWFGGLIDGMRDASGLQYRRNRCYDPTTGRFTQEDPIGLAGGMNLYGYANGDPVNLSDPFGLLADTVDVGCRPLEGAKGAVGNHCAVRVSSGGTTTATELQNPGGRNLVGSLDPNDPRYNWTTVPVPPGMTQGQFDASVLHSIGSQARLFNGRPYSSHSLTNSNNFVFQVITGAGGVIPRAAVPRWGKTPGLCGGGGRFELGDACVF